MSTSLPTTNPPKPLKKVGTGHVPVPTKITTWLIFSIFSVDPAEPLLAVALILCVTSWPFSFLGQLHGYLLPAVVCFAWMRIHALGRLKEQLDRFEKENNRLHTSNKELKRGIETLHMENRNLEDSNQRLEASISGLDNVKDTLQQFAAQSQSSFEDVLKSLNDGIAEQKIIQVQTKQIANKTKMLAATQERSMLMNLFMQFEDQDGEKGLSKDEFDCLVDVLPEETAAKLRDSTESAFASMDIDGDGLISIKDFREWLRALTSKLPDGKCNNVSSSPVASTTAQYGSHEQEMESMADQRSKKA
mmetsp:Transcript_14146/g.27950  ORF Transcript_14146/g.27950 Transcript_14146/m.27950 type:complete len:304 (+) Transcript_14146:125-1036(+)